MEIKSTFMSTPASFPLFGVEGDIEDLHVALLFCFHAAAWAEMDRGEQLCQPKLIK